MHPIDHYYTIRRGQEELLRQAERERMVRAASRKVGAGLAPALNQRLHRMFANWLGTHMVNWGQKLERFGAPGRFTNVSSVPQEH